MRKHLVICVLLLSLCMVESRATWADTVGVRLGGLAGDPSGAAFNIVTCNQGGNGITFPSSASCSTGAVSGIASDGSGYSTSAAASGALANASLAAFATSSSASDEATGQATVTLFDVLSFRGGSGGSTAAITITASGTLDGTSAAGITFEWFALSTGFEANANANTQQNGSACLTKNFAGVDPITTCASSDGKNLLLSSAMPVDVGAIALTVALSVDANGTGAANYSDPITITLPAGVTFTSESGLFLTAPSTVPEPSSFLLLVTGLVGTLSAARRRMKLMRVAHP